MRALHGHLERRFRMKKSEIAVVVSAVLERGTVTLNESQTRLKSARTDQSRQPNPTAKTASPVDDSWADLRVTIALRLSEIDVDTLYVAVMPRAGSDPIVKMRVDPVGNASDAEFWTALLVEDPAVAGPLLNANPRTLSPRQRLPLRPVIVEGLTVPMTFVWTAKEPHSSAKAMCDLLKQDLEVSAKRIRIRAVRCSAVEHNRRLDLADTVRRVSGHRRARRLAVAYCERCGQPLSDQASVRLGIGPECLKHYSHREVKAIRSGTTHPLRHGALKPSAWARAVVNGWESWSIEGEP